MKSKVSKRGGKLPAKAPPKSVELWFEYLGQDAFEAKFDDARCHCFPVCSLPLLVVVGLCRPREEQFASV